MSKTKHSGLNILRIFVMLQIVYGHFMLYGGIKERMINEGGINNLIYYLFFFTSRCPVYILIALSGYFLIQKTDIVQYCKKKIINTWIVMLFYSFVISFIIVTAVLLYKGEAGIKPVAKNFISGVTPFLGNKWYYMTNYILVLAVAPIINVGLSKVSQKYYTIILAGGLFVLSAWPVLSGLSDLFSMNYIIDHLEGKSFLNFVYMYMLGGYIAKYGSEFKCPKILSAGIFVLSAVANTILVYMIPSYLEYAKFNDNFLSIIQCVCLILFFKNIKINSVIINKISKGNIGVYLITEHGAIRSYLWSKLNAELIWSENKFIIWINIFLIVVVVYLLSNIAEQIRALVSNKMHKVKTAGYKV